MFCFTLEVAKGELEEDELKNNLRFFLNMKESIAQQLKPRPDCLLVDSRSGIMERTGVCTRLWADDVVFLFLNNRESLEGLRLLWRSLVNALRLPWQKPLHSVFALTRIPDLRGDKRRSSELKEKVKEMVKYLNEGIKKPSKRLKAEDIYILHSDRELEFKEELRIKLEGPIDEKLLSYEYINIFSRIMPKKNKSSLNWGSWTQ